METVTIDNIQYQKASSVARDFGYTTDYIGQLARKGKIGAQLVGRSWFVDPSSLKAHKKTRHRSTLLKTKEALKKTDTKPNSSSAKAPKIKKFGENFYTRTDLADAIIRYEHDASSLVPTLSPEEKRGRIPVELADATKISVTKQTSATSLTATAKPEISFKGGLEVNSVEDAEVQIVEAENGGNDLQTSPLNKLLTKPKIKVRIDPKATATGPKIEQKISPQTSATKAKMGLVRKQVVQAETQRTVSIEVTSQSTSYRFSQIAAVFVLVIVTTILGLGGALTLENHITASDKAVQSAIVFDTQYLMSASFIPFKI